MAENPASRKRSARNAAAFGTWPLPIDVSKLISRAKISRASRRTGSDTGDGDSAAVSAAHAAIQNPRIKAAPSRRILARAARGLALTRPCSRLWQLQGAGVGSKTGAVRQELQ